MLSEPEVSATVLRQQRREAESSDSKLDSFNLSAVVSSLKKSEVSGNSSEASFVVVDEVGNIRISHMTF